MLKLVCCVVCCLMLSACASPNVWVQSRGANSGVIGYQNYNPASDNNAMIAALIPCKRYMLVYNPVRSSSNAPMYVGVGNISVPVSDTVQWAEYHYECIR